MSLTIILLLLGSAVLHAVWNAIIKGGSNKLFEAVMKTGGGALITIPIVCFLPLPAREA